MDKRSSVETTKIRVYIKNLNLSMKKHTFNGVHIMRIFESLNRFLNETDTRSISEAKYFVALPTFLEDPAQTQFQTNISGDSWHCSVIC